MRLREWLTPLLLLAIVGGAGCSRLSFVKPNLKHRDYQQVAPEYKLRGDSPRDALRVVALDQIALAAQSLQANQFDAAAAQAAQAIKADPNSGDAYTLLAMAEERRGQTAQAGAYYAKAVALNPQRGTALNNYGSWLCGQGRYAESLLLFDRALADPAYATPGAALANAGSCALSAGQAGRAQRDLGQALALDPANPVALEGMASARFQAGQYMEARAFSERRLAVAPASVKLLQLASQIEQKLGDTAASARYLQRISTEFPQQRTPSPGGASQP